MKYVNGFYLVGERERERERYKGQRESEKAMMQDVNN